jgi:tetratricopeptide (TPR) repeat protein
MSFYFDMPLKELQTSVQNNPFEIDLWLALIQRFAEAECMEDAFEEIFVAEDIFPENAELQAMKSLCLLSVGEIREGHDLLQKSLRRSPGDEMVERVVNEFLPSFKHVTEDHLLNPYAIRENATDSVETAFLARLESTIELIQTFNENESDPDQLIEPLERHVQNFPGDINAKLDLARLCLNVGNHRKARQYYQIVIKEDPLCASAYFELATIEPDSDVAIDLSEQGLEMCPMFQCGRYNYATLLLKQGMLKEGRNEMLRIPADSSFYVLGLEAIANSHSEQGNLAEAIKIQEKVVSLSVDNAEAWNCYGHFFAEMGEFETALKHFDRVIQLDSEHLDGLHNRALMLTRLGRSEEAVHVLRYAYSIDRNDASILFNLGVELARIGQVREAIELTEGALERFPQNAKLWLNLGSFHHRSSQLHEAINCGKKAIELVPDSAHAWWNVACAYAELEKREEALSALRRSLELHPQSADQVRNEVAFARFTGDNNFEKLLK